MKVFSEGIMFDGSSIAGWKAINESDMTLMPDPASSAMDPFFAAPTLSIVCDILEPSTGEPYNRDPRGIAKRAEAFAASTGIGDVAYFGPEAEFFVFDDVRSRPIPTTPASCSTRPTALERRYAPMKGGNLGHRIRTKSGLFSRCRRWIRRKTCAAKCSPPWRQWAPRSRNNHHEVASAQHELGLKFGPLTTMADHLQIYKYCIHQVAQSYGKTATLHAEASLRRQWLGHACASVDLEGRQAALRRQ